MNRSIEKRVDRLNRYWSTYTEQIGYENYSDKTFINDALYGIGIALDDKYKYAEGFREFKKYLIAYLEKETD